MLLLLILISKIHINISDLTCNRKFQDDFLLIRIRMEAEADPGVTGTSLIRIRVRTFVETDQDQNYFNSDSQHCRVQCSRHRY